MMLLLTFFFSGIIVLSIIILGFKWKKLKIFFHDDNYTYFDFLFIIIYFLEQAIFVILSYFYPQYNSLLIGFFALVVVTTVSIQKVMMESKNRKLETYNNQYILEFKLMREDYERTLKFMKNYISQLEKENEEFRKKRL